MAQNARRMGGKLSTLFKKRKAKHMTKTIRAEEEKKKQAEEKRNPRPGLSPGHLRFLLLYKGVRLMVTLEFNHETYF
jgi:hypothetical protein